MTNYRNQLNNLLTEYTLAKRQVKAEKDRQKETRANLEALQQAQKIVQTVAEQVQTEAHGKITAIVNRCLKAIFGKGAYEFAIRFVSARGKTEAKLVFLKNGEELDPKLAVGGGTVDVAAFALRLTDLLLARPARRRLIISDEPFKWINGETYQERTAGMLDMLAEDFGFRFVFVSDDSWMLQTGKVIEL